MMWALQRGGVVSPLAVLLPELPRSYACLPLTQSSYLLTQDCGGQKPGSTHQRGGQGRGRGQRHNVRAQGKRKPGSQAKWAL